jgi:hypothetical protein
VLALLVVAAAVTPMAGGAVALVIVVLSFFVAGWAFRLAVFGTVFSWDFLTFRREGTAADGSVRAFATSLPQVPCRTWGTLSRGGTGLVFRWRPWLVLPERTAAMPPAASVGIGIVSPVIFGQPEGGGVELVRLPPRYRRAHLEIGKALGGLPAVEVPLVKGIRAAIAWVRGAAAGAAGAPGEAREQTVGG